MVKQSVAPAKYGTILLGGLVLFGLYLTSLYSYLLFHSLAEIFSIVIAFSIFILAWNSRRFLDNYYLLFLGIAYFFIGSIDLIHTLTYKGMAVFLEYDANLPTQLWIAARYLESLSLLAGLLFLRRKFNPHFVLIGYTVVVSTLLGAIFYWRVFPDCFIEGSGLTPFKKISEYIISLLLFASIVLLWLKRENFEAGVLRLLIISIIFTIGSELALTFYISIYDFPNLIGHFFKIISFYFIYKALIKVGLTQPYNLLFRNLKQSEAALRKSEVFLNNVIEQSPHAMWVSDDKGTLIRLNQACRDLLHITDEEVVGKYNVLKDNIVEEQALLPLVKSVFEEGQIVQFMIEYDSSQLKHLQLEDTTYVILEVTIFPIKDTNGRVINAVIQHKDITKQKKAEEALKAYSERLEEMVEERTRELKEAQEQLVRQEKLAVLGQLAGGVAHELRNPLGTLKNAVYFLNMVLEASKPEVKESLEILNRQVGISDRIISSLLDFARTRVPVQHKVDINVVLQEVLANTVVPESIELVSQLDESLPTTLVDPDQLSQVFDNLIRNAIQAMPEGGQLVVRSKVMGSEEVRVSFTDMGPGISEENLEKIFEPLFTTKAKGIGLGLALVKTLVEGNGGIIEVKSDGVPGKGSVFTVRLPLVVE